MKRLFVIKTTINEFVDKYTKMYQGLFSLSHSERNYRVNNLYYDVIIAVKHLTCVVIIIDYDKGNI